MTKPPCSIDGCDTPAKARGMCNKHYKRWRKTPEGQASTNRNSRPLIDRLLSRVEITDTCWLWTGTLDHGGYGRMWDNRRQGQAQAHRLSYELHVGPIPDGLQIDHLCRVRHCVNPEHLEPVTPLVNTRRSYAPGQIWRHTGCCRRGHPWTDENVYVSGDGSYAACRACRRLNDARRRQRAAQVPTAGPVVDPAPASGPAAAPSPRKGP